MSKELGIRPSPLLLVLLDKPIFLANLQILFSQKPAKELDNVH
jgi:hypothetical protein